MSTPTTTDKHLKYRGDLRALLGQGTTLAFVTVHPEGQATAVYRADPEKGELSADPLPAGGEALAADDQHLYVAGSDKRIYRGPAGGGALSPLGGELEAPPRELALLSEERLAVLTGAQVLILGRKDGKTLQTLDLPEEGTALAADPEGLWLVAGTKAGTLAVFDCEDKKEFMAAESAKPHNGAVTALLFEPEELRVLSIATDNQLLLTHVRGALEPEDRGGKGAHSGAVPALLHHPEGELLYSAGHDAELRVWTKGQKRPKTHRDGVGRAVDLALVEVKGRLHLAVAADDNTIRLFQLDAAGKVTHRAMVIRDAYAWARRELSDKEPLREAALAELHGWADAASVDLLSNAAGTDPKHGLRVRATELLGTVGHPKATGHLENLLRGEAEAVRLAALGGLRNIEGESALRPLELALNVQKPDVGVEAVKALGELASEDDQALDRLIRALNDHPAEVRLEALSQLEGFYPDEGPEAELTALAESSHADVRFAAVLRCYQREMLDKPAVLGAIRRHGADQDGRVRHAAFYVSLLSRPKLAGALRYLDKEIHRQLHGLETHGQEIDPEAKLPKPAKVKADKLKAEDIQPLLEAMASRALDTCLKGAWGLSLLQDPRAFGTLLQLSREPDEGARVEVCQAFEKLGDPRGMQRLRLLLRDPAEQVRDAAFTALSRMLSGDPLEAAEAGLLADHEDVRKRGLKLLTRLLKKKLPPKPDDPAYELLERALNDGAPAVRGEAFKVCLNLGVFGGGVETLRFALRSLHADVRKEVLTEAMGEVEQDWAWELLLELFDDPDPGLRQDALKFARKKSKGKALEPLERALRSRYVDIRFEAVQALGKKVKDDTLPLLIEALDDEEENIRAHAIEALVTAEADEALIGAMDGSELPDIKVRAAAASAELGEPRALEVLLEQVAEPEPELGDLATKWRDRMARALDGLATLGDPQGAGAARPLLDHKHPDIRRAAARTLAWCQPTGDLSPLYEALRHDDAEVKRVAALGLAWLGDPRGSSLIFTAPQPTTSGGRRKKKKKPAVAASGSGAEPAEALIAAMTLDQEDLFLSFFDHDNDQVRERALRLHLMQEWRENDGVPDRCLAGLSSAHPRVRLVAARALEHFGDTESFGEFVTELINERGDHEKPWEIAPEVVETVAEAVTFGDSRLRVRAAKLLDALEEKKQAAFDRAWRRFNARFGAACQDLLRVAKKRKPAKPAYSPEALTQIVFGAYIGLSRQDGGYGTHRVRQSALKRLAAMATAERADLADTAPVMVQALGDSHSAVRVQSFDALSELGFDESRLSSEALATKQRDVAVRGLKLLSEGAGKESAVQVLEEVMVGYTDGLEHDVAKLLAERIGWAETHARSLEARSVNLRFSAVYGLSNLYEKDEKAREALKAALDSRFKQVRTTAAVELAYKKAPEAFDPLVKLLAADQHGEQSTAINALQGLNDPRGPDALLDRVENDPAGTANQRELFQAAGSFRRPENADRLLKMMEDKRYRSLAGNALVTISGYDQWLGHNDLRPEDETWLKGQFPRHDEVLARLIEAAREVNDTALLRRMMPHARWAKGKELGGALAPLITFKDDLVRRAAVEALGWRLRHRDGSADPLVEALGHQDPLTQFNAAEGLALAGRDDGLNVLLAAVETMDDLTVRTRAVKALGELAHERALDLLLRLANEDYHALQEPAAEALGHLGQSDKADKVFDLLQSLAKSTMTGVADHALRGLRWLNTREGWGLIRERINDPSWAIRSTVVELLRHDEDPASREALIKVITEDQDWSLVRSAAQGLRQLDGPDSLEPDYVFVQSAIAHLENDTLQRLRERGEPGRLMEVLPKIHPWNQSIYFQPLVAILLSREPLPVAEAAAALDSPHPQVVEVAAHILGRAGTDAAKEHGKALVAATNKALEAWNQTLATYLDAEVEVQNELAPRIDDLTAALKRLVWACGRLEVGDGEVIAATELGGTGALGRSIRIAAVTALAESTTKYAGKKGLKALTQAAIGADAGLRIVASAGLSRLDPKAGAALAEKALDDRTSLARLVAGAEDKKVEKLLRESAGKVHVQGVALPHLVARGDVKGLSEALADRKLPEAARLGALEGLSRIATEAAEKPILKLARDEKEEESLRKAAWRALRRSKRLRAKRDSREGEVSR